MGIGDIIIYFIAFFLAIFLLAALGNLFEEFIALLERDEEKDKQKFNKRNKL